MKHKISVTILLIAMFLVTQFIGLLVVNSYFPVTQTIVDPSTGEAREIEVENPLPFGLENRENSPNFLSIVFSFVLAVALVFFLMKYRWKKVIKVWFFLVVIIALSISLNAVLKNFLVYASVISLVVAFPLAFFKVFRPSYIVHNATELFIYPGIAAVFVTLLTPFSALLVLVLISIYDMWAVWKSGIMQKMAKFQMEEIKVFGGLLIPSLSNKDRNEIKIVKQKYRNKEIPKKYKKRKYKVNLAILGGGDIIFPIIASGVFLKFFGIIPALFVTFGALAGLIYLFSITEKGKSYPAMPYISAGIFIGVLLALVFRFI
ncbi:MAG: presenilin family intramembrane aspartyl protease [Candidatus Pacearchaeota archaeon]